jgi:hypothetical protein
MAVMGNGDIIVGKSASHRIAKTVIIEKLAQRAGASTPAQSPAPQERHCGAMSEQPCYGGMISTPQKLLHLVGCRDAKAKPAAR